MTDQQAINAVRCLALINEYIGSISKHAVWLMRAVIECSNTQSYPQITITGGVHPGSSGIEAAREFLAGIEAIQAIADKHGVYISWRLFKGEQ